MKLSQSAREQADMLEEVLLSAIPASRRNFLKRGALAAAAAASLPIIGANLNSCSKDSTTQPTDNPNKSDIAILTDAYLIETLAVNTYKAANATGLLTGAFQQVALSFAADHTQHAAVFKNVITSTLKGDAPADPAATENFVTGVQNGAKFKVVPVMGNLTSAVGIVRYALALELTAAQAYFDNATNADSTKRLANAQAIEAVSDIAPVEAEHAAVFRAALKLLLNTTTDRDAGTDIGKSISPTPFLSTEAPKP